MSRRPLQRPAEELAKAQSRMAPGGRVWSESPIPRKWVVRVPMIGPTPEDVTPPRSSTTLPDAMRRPS